MQQGFFGQPAQQIGSYSNFSPEQNQFFQNFLGNQGNYDLNQNPNFQQAQKILSQFPGSQPFNQNQYENYFQQGVANPTIRNYQENILPGILSQYHGQGGYSQSGLQRAIAHGSSNLAQGLGELRSNYLSQSQQNHGNQQLQAIMQALGLAKAPSETANNALNARPQGALVEQGGPSDIISIIRALLPFAALIPGIGPTIAAVGTAAGGIYDYLNHGNGPDMNKDNTPDWMNKLPKVPESVRNIYAR